MPLASLHSSIFKLYAATSLPNIGILEKEQVTHGWFTLFQVLCVVHNFKGSQMLSEDPQQEDVMSSPKVESPLEKYIASQVQHSCIYLHQHLAQTSTLI